MKMNRDKESLDEGLDESLDESLGNMPAEEGLQEERLFTKARDMATRYLGYRARTRAEVWGKLTDAGFSEDITERVMELLARYNYVNDGQYARDYVESRVNTRRLGKARILRELRQRGIAEELIAEAFARFEAELEEPPEDAELAMALEHLRKKTRDNRELDEKERKRCLGYLARRGFGFETAIKALKTYTSGEDDVY